LYEAAHKKTDKMVTANENIEINWDRFSIILSRQNKANRPERNIMAKAKTQGDCGGTPKKDGSGAGTGNAGTSNQPKKKK